MKQNRKLNAGDWVEVRSKEEILATLDEKGQLDKLPFMPEMFQFCGRRFRVWKRAHKTCDTVTKTGGRWLTDAVHLEELRCDGQAHGGCQAQCLLFWKVAWLKPVAGSGIAGNPIASTNQPAAVKSSQEEKVFAATLAEGQQNAAEPTYVCQATKLPEYTTLLPWWDVRQFWEDYTSGNFGLRRMLPTFIYAAYHHLTRLPVGGRTMARLYDWFQRLRGGVPFPDRKGTVPDEQPTPSGALNLQAGELVRVKRHPEILCTLDGCNKNRGLYFGTEEVPFCGGTYRVKGRVGKIINEQTGKMMKFKTESVILDGVYCEARYSDKRLFCPRAIYPFWREIWLERVSGPDLAGKEGNKKTGVDAGKPVPCA